MVTKTMREKLRTPRVRAVVFNAGAAVYCGLWFRGGTLPGAELDAMTAVVGVVIPFGVVNLLLALMYKPVQDWDRRVPQNERTGAAREQVRS